MRQQKYTKVYDGEGDTIILLHGFLSSKAYWKRLQPLLSARGYRVVTIDLLGFGSAPKPKDREYTYSDHIDHIEKTIHHIGITGNPIVIGHSMGALLATRWARLNPSKMKSLILINPPLYTSSEQASETLRRTSWLYRFLLDSKHRHFVWVVLRTIRPFLSHSRSSREGSLRNIIEAADVFDDLSAVKSKTLVINGMRDRQEYITNSKSASFSNNIRIEYENVTHHAARKDAKLVANHIHSFVT